MSVLLDTHVLLWFQALDKRISPALRHRIENADEEYFVSLVSFWEIAIKTSIGKLNLDRDLNSTFQLVHEAGFSILPLREEHILESRATPPPPPRPFRPDVDRPSEDRGHASPYSGPALRGL
jgi:PIN domain nuclease of toxin-antitoxin system